MGFCIGTTIVFGFYEGQAMDLNTMVWIVSLCLALQRHHGDQLLSLRAKNSDKGEQRSTYMKKEFEVMAGEAEQIS